MATRLITPVEFRSSRYADVADQVTNIETIIEQAEAHVENKLDRRFARDTYVEIHRPVAQHVYLRQRPILEITSVEQRLTPRQDWSLMDLNDFELEPNGATATLYAWDDNIRGYELRVTYDAGYDPVPPDIKAAVILKTVVLAYTDFEVFGGGDGKEPAIAHLSIEIDRLLKPYKKQFTS